MQTEDLIAESKEPSVITYKGAYIDRAEGALRDSKKETLLPLDSIQNCKIAYNDDVFNKKKMLKKGLIKENCLRFFYKEKDN